MHPVIMGRAEPRAGARRACIISVETPRHSTARPSRRDRAGLDDLHRPDASSTAMSTRSGQASPRSSASPPSHFGVDAGLSLDQRGLHADRPCARSSAGRPRSATAYLVATGFNAWGISNGTAAAMLIADLVEGRDNPWLDLFDATRIKPIAGAAEFVEGNAADRVAPGRRLSRAQAARASTRWRRARRRSSRSTAAMSPAIATRRARSTRSRRSAPIWAAWSAGTRPTGPGTAPATARASPSTASVIHGPAVKPLEPVEVKAEAESRLCFRNGGTAPCAAPRPVGQARRSA